MIETVVVATDGSASVERAVSVALDLADRFEATVHALYVVDEDDIAEEAADQREEAREALTDRGDDSLAAVRERAGREVVTEVRVGRPADVICTYADESDADVVAMGTRGRHGEYRFLLGSVAEAVVDSCPVPVLTVRQLASA
ncbi:universal stress protein [Halococcus sp. IIIV-5B]|uniref:universal stress protein n=1 Tax=Halococcus sp. IIIV-5B TaxID=2321230 RepID=UPI000E7582C6|nr:universal stress protein [Halococcus sp. IIIV-5B]RJT06186.1 universal stress protein [Halococcus sp. IIIV-5B]